LNHINSTATGAYPLNTTSILDHHCEEVYKNRHFFPEFLVGIYPVEALSF
jgi:hypothetical protein